MLTRKKIILSSTLVLFLLMSAASALGAVIAGPTLDMAESGWHDFGLLIRAEKDVTLVSVRYPNRGRADVVELRRNSDSAVLASIPVPAGDRDATVNINYPLTSQEVYALVATTPNNRYFGSPGAFVFPAGNADMTVLASYYGGLYYDYWFSFNDIVTESGTPELGIVIDIKPGSTVNNINLKSKGVVPVAILTTEDFNALDVDAQSVLFAGAGPVRWQIEDVDGDGDDDIILHFRTEDLNFSAGDMSTLSTDNSEAVLTGTTFEGIPFSGSEAVNIIHGK